MPTEDISSKGSFILYLSDWEWLKKLSDERLGRLVRAVYEREAYGSPVDLSDDEVLDMAYLVLSKQLDINRKKWERTRDARSEAGRRSGEIRRRKKEQNEQMLDLKTRREHSEQVPMVLNKDEEAEHLSDLSNTYEPNVDVDDNDNENGNEKENVDGDGDTARTSTSTTNIISRNYCFWDFYPIFMEYGFNNPISVTQEFVDYYEGQHWTLRGGEVLSTLEAKIAKAKTWNKEDRWKRTEMEFLATWCLLCQKMKELHAPDEIWKAAHDERIKVEYDFTASIMRIHLPKSVGKYIENSPPLLDLLRTLKNDKGLDTIHYLFVRENSMTKYRLRQ